MKKIFLSHNPSDYRGSLAHRQTLADSIRFSREIGFRSVVFREALKRPDHYMKLLSSWISADVIVTIYPSFCRYNMFRDNPLRDADELLFVLLHRLKGKTRTILFLYDLPIEQAIAEGKQSDYYDEKSYRVESRILECFDILCVYNDNMRKAIGERYGIPKDRFVEFEVHDYGRTPTLWEPKRRLEGKWNIVVAGNGDKSYAGDWANRLTRLDNITYEFLGPNWDWISRNDRSDFTRKFFESHQELCDYVYRNADFGIIAYSDSMNRYFEYCCPSKVGTYVTAGVPILASSDCTYVSHLVRKYGIGLTFDSFDELPLILQSLSQSEYYRMRSSCLRLAQKISSGYFFKRAIADSLKKLDVT